MPPEQVTVIKLVLTSLIISRVFCSPYTSLQVKTKYNIVLSNLKSDPRISMSLKGGHLSMNNT